jgi:hypothetical protein
MMPVPSIIHTTKSSALSTRVVLRSGSSSNTKRSVSSSPYGRTHVWKRRPKRLPNPIVPQFPQRVIRSDGSSYTHWTTSPRPLIRLTRDVTNHPLWNVAAALRGEGVLEESEVTGRLGRFNRKFVEEVDWMSEAEMGSSDVAAAAAAAQPPPPPKKKDDAAR